MRAAVQLVLAVILAVSTVALERRPAPSTHMRETRRGVRPDAEGEAFVALLKAPHVQRALHRDTIPGDAALAPAPQGPPAPPVAVVRFAADERRTRPLLRHRPTKAPRAPPSFPG